MRLCQKAKHFFGAIVASRWGLAFCGIFLLLGYLANKYSNVFAENYYTSVTVGIFASIVASIVFNITGKYTDSINAYRTIKNTIMDSCNILQNSIDKQTACDANKATLWSSYMYVCALSDKLTYLGDYDKLVPAFYKLATCQRVETASTELPELDEVFAELKNL